MTIVLSCRYILSSYVQIVVQALSFTVLQIMTVYADQIANLGGFEHSECPEGTFAVIRICTKYAAEAIVSLRGDVEANTTRALDLESHPLHNCIYSEIITLFVWSVNILWFAVQLCYFIQCPARCVHMGSTCFP